MCNLLVTFCARYSRIFGTTVTGEWRKFRSEERHILYSSPNIIRQIKLRRVKLAGHVTRM
jgi:hypothetical protein